jgi:peptidoglycan hydrolase CwlO-like protein
MNKTVAWVVVAGMIVVAIIAAVVLKGAWQKQGAVDTESEVKETTAVQAVDGVSEEDYQMEDLDAELSGMEEELGQLEKDLKSLD